MRRFIPPGVRNASREGICEAVRRESQKKTDLERSLDQNRSAKMSETLGAAEVEFTSEDLPEIESASSNIEVEGARYPERLEQMSGP